MRNYATRIFNQSLLLSVTSSLAIMAFEPAAVAQDAGSDVPAQSVAIPAGQLGDTLFAISTKFNVQIMADERLVEGKTAPAISGAFTAQQAIVQALTGSGLVATERGSSGYVLRRFQAPKPKRRGLIDVETIIVKGEKFDRTLQETVTSIAVFDEETIDRQNFVDLADILDQTANVSSNGLTIRGLPNEGAAIGIQNPSGTSTVYLDGVFLPEGSGNLTSGNLWDVESVEIFRGPQSTVQGRNAMIGGVVLRSVDPGNEFSGKAQLRYGEFNSLRASAALTVPILRDQLSLRVAADYTETDGFVDNLTLGTDDAARSEDLTARAKLLITPNALPNLTARVNFTYIDREAQTNRIDEALFPEQRASLANVQGVALTESFQISGEIEYDLSEKLKLTSVTAYIESTSDTEGDNDAREIGPSFPTFISNFDDTVFSQELRLSYSSDRLDFIFGGYYFNSDDEIEQDIVNSFPTSIFTPPGPVLAGLLFNTPSPSPDQILQGNAIRDQILATAPTFDLSIVGGAPNSVENLAAFGEVNYRVTDKLTLTFGARFDSENLDQRSVVEQSIRPLPPSGDPTVDQVINLLVEQLSVGLSQRDIGTDTTYTAFLPKGVITYNWTEDLSTSFSVQRGYRAGGLSFNPLRFNQAQLDGAETDEEFAAAGALNQYDPEFTTNYEFALRSQWFERRLTVNANVFYIDYTDQQVDILLSADPNDNITANVSSSRLIGFELETFANPFDGLDLYANVGFTDTEFLSPAELTGALAGGQIVNDLTGSEFRLSPRWTVGFGGRYTHSTGLFANLRFRYTGSSFNVADNNPERNPASLTAINDSFITVDAILGYQQEHYSIELFGDNLFDDDYLTNNPLDGRLGAFANAGDPRVLGVRVTGNF